MSLLLHYKAIDTFRKQYFKNLLTEEHLQGGEKYFKNVTDIDGEEYLFNRFCHVIEKDGKKYLLESQYLKDLPISVDQRGIEKIAYRSEAYYFITKHHPAKILPKKTLTFKQLVDTLTNIEHNQPLQQRINVLIDLSQIMDRAYCRKASTPAFGKDSSISILGSLMFNSLTIENPTIAKLELLAGTAKLLAINEINDISRADWKMIEQFLLAVGAFKHDYTKRSRATSGVGERIDISKLSVSLMYNDIDCYDNSKHYFDVIATRQVKDRFPAYRFYGEVTENFDGIDNININTFVKDHWEEYKAIVNTIAHYCDTDNLGKELHNYTNNHPLPSRKRQQLSLQKVLRLIDVDSESQEEYDQKVEVLLQSMKEYEAMSKYSTTVAKLVKHYEVDKADAKEIHTINDLLLFKQNTATNSDRKKDSFQTMVSTLQTFIKEESFIKLNEDVDRLINTKNKPDPTERFNKLDW